MSEPYIHLMESENMTIIFFTNSPPFNLTMITLCIPDRMYDFDSQRSLHYEESLK